jgi:cytosine/adenosine deaminase-related metal-dependent hydrolase
MLLRARAVVPVSSAVIPDGAVLVRNGRIRAVGSWRELQGPHDPVIDLGEVLLLPGLINAHCHLDYTSMAGQFPPPRRFTDWIKQIVTCKNQWTSSDYAESWREGARMLLHSGVTTVADIEARPELLPEVWNATPLRVFSFLEMIGITGRRTAEAILDEAIRKALTLKHPRNRAHVSPHAPYSTLPDLLTLTATTARELNMLVHTHVAESRVEYQMFARARGEMHLWLRRSGRVMKDCGRGSPAQHLARCGLLGGNLIAAHVNYLGRNDAKLLARSHTHVVHCPRSHEYFSHQRFPLRRLRQAGVNIALGTDSLASVCKKRHQTVELSMFEEMRVLLRRQPGLRPSQILKMATMNGALALGMRGEIGELAPGALADVIALPYSGPLRNAYQAVVEHSGPVRGSMIQGNWALPPT